ncbi:hypothetical protein EYF80_017644 [Liparis tanakae]|uniref:Uncharacterized protein n=1 Tax=Liparis tanakae TaxID=230148 RepID=A0A4Z2I246_9TELE|nr:hypothetical protein EYF80_017644 [Liparis tanakae]
MGKVLKIDYLESILLAHGAICRIPSFKRWKRWPLHLEGERSAEFQANRPGKHHVHLDVK